MKIDFKNEKHFVADDGKVFQRRTSGESYGKELLLGYSYYIDSVLQDSTHKDVIEDFEEVLEQNSKVEVEIPEKDIINTVIQYYDKDEDKWYKVYFDKKLHPTVSWNEIYDGVINDINNRTDEKILNGFIWREIPVYLSKENQFNFKAAYDLALQTQGASLPVKFKLGQTSIHYENIGTEENPEYIRCGGEPVYYTFKTLEDISDFYVKTIAFINQTLNEGWQKKDSIDWSVYQDALNPQPEVTEEPTEE